MKFTRFSARTRLIGTLSVTLAIASGDASALNQAECTSVRMDHGTGAVAQMPILNQGNAGICFAYTATQLVDSWRHSRRGTRRFRASNLRPGQPQVTSPLPPSFSLAHAERRFNEFEGGLVNDALGQLRAHGSCSHDDVFGPNSSTAFAGPREQSLRTRLMDTFDNFMALLTRRNADDPYETRFTTMLRRVQQEHPDWSPSRQSLEAKYRLALPLAGQLCEYMQRESFPLPRSTTNTAIDSTYIIAAHMAVSVEAMDADTGFVDRYFANVCRGKTESLADLPALHEQIYRPEQSQQFLTDLHARLNRANPLPVSISYCANVLTMPHPYNGYHLNANGQVRCAADPNDPDDDGKGAHASIIVGRRWNAARGTCQLLVRNTWGETCDSDYSTRAPWSCSSGSGERAGQIWVDEQAIGRNSWGLEYLNI